MQGYVKTFIPEKGYGFIKGNDRKDYFFHQSDFKTHPKEREIFDGAKIDFEPKATPKGYRATQCIIISIGVIRDSFELPHDFIKSKSERVNSGLTIIEKTDWIIHGSARGAPEGAKLIAIERAQSIGANALLNLQYYTTTGSEPGTGKGTHHFTIHNYRGTPSVVAKKITNASKTKEELSIVSSNAHQLKNKLKQKTNSEMKKARWIWLAVWISAFTVADKIPYIIALFVLGAIFGSSSYHDGWLVNKHNKLTELKKEKRSPKIIPTTILSASAVYTWYMVIYTNSLGYLPKSKVGGDWIILTVATAFFLAIVIHIFTQVSQPTEK
jgi:cold shock CspA family protein